MRPPDYQGGGLVNLVAELEYRLTGSSAARRLRPPLGDLIPQGDSYLFVLIDGLGDHQLAHREATRLRDFRVAALDASFSTQTTVSTATLSTGIPPSQHGLIAYLLRLPELQRVANTIFWFDAEGAAVDIDYGSFLPAPNLAERLAAGGAESVLIEPAGFVESPLERVLYRGATIVGSDSDRDSVRLALEWASRPGRLVAVYVPQVDAAAHAAGQQSDLYALALREATELWTAIVDGLPAGVVAVGTADHGHVDVSPANNLRLPDLPGVTFYGDSRVVYVAGDTERAAALAADLPALWLAREEMDGWWGPGPYHPDFEARRPDGALAADDGFAFQYPGNETVMVGYHGGLTQAELRIPLLVAPPVGGSVSPDTLL